MPLTSDISINAAKFSPDAVTEHTKQAKERLLALSEAGPKWWEVGAAEYRAMRRRGETPIPQRDPLPGGVDFGVPSRAAGREIPCRVRFPAARTTRDERRACRGSVLHIHGGGWVLGELHAADALLQAYADAGDLAVVTVGYRLAPEDPFPAAPDDCVDVAEWMVRESEGEYGGPLRFIGGESAGGHLSLLTVFHLLKAPDFKLDGLLLHFGCYDLSMFAQALNYTKPLIINREITRHFLDAFIPNMSLERQKKPDVSPYYEDLEKWRGRLPSALFTCGTDDMLLDDSVVMGTKWMMAGGEAYVKIYEGAPHAFIGFPDEFLEGARQVKEDTRTYIRDVMAAI